MILCDVGYIALAILLAFMIGVIQLIMGILRMGFLVNFLSHPVITGFTSAAAIIIAFSQLQHFLGIPLPRTNQIHEILAVTLHNIGAVNIPTLLLGVTGIVSILFLRRWKNIFPSQLFVVVSGIMIVWLLELDESGVRIVGEVPQGLPSFSPINFNINVMHSLLPLALAISLVSFMESIAVAKAMAQRHRDYKLDSNQELIGLGAANISGAFFQSFPVTGGFSRTAVNEQAGAKTGLAAIISAGLIGITLLFLTPLFTYLPNAILAAIILVAVLGLIDISEMKFLWNTKREDFAMCAITFFATLFIGIEEGIATGVVLSLVMVVYRSTRPHVAVLGRLPGTNIYRNIKRFPQVEQRDDLLIIRFDSQLYFANVEYFKETLRKLEEEKRASLKLVIIDAASMSSIDTSGVHALKEVIDDYKKRDIALYLTGVIGPVRDTLNRARIMQYLGEEQFFLDVSEAVAYSEDQKKKPIKGYTLQTLQ
ncbi:SulP family inorganic anion transporter [Nitrosomonas communis]|uniref:SulP family inorganic anion transporter n=1 Tax=Nitrosomonas communis TaxID=44574 RepID=UPI0034E98341